MDEIDNFPDECTHVIEVFAQIYCHDAWTKEQKMTQDHRITSYNVCYTKLLRPLPTAGPLRLVLTQKGSGVDFFLFVITSYSIHYTKLYDFNGLHDNRRAFCDV